LVPIELHTKELQAVCFPPARIATGRLGDQQDSANSEKRGRGLGSNCRGSESSRCNKVGSSPERRITPGLLTSLPAHVDAVVEPKRVKGLGEPLGPPAVGVEEEPPGLRPHQRQNQPWDPRPGPKVYRQVRRSYERSERSAVGDVRLDRPGPQGTLLSSPGQKVQQ
jgi:hypothetical protein